MTINWNPEALNVFWYWVAERHKIWSHRAHGFPAPWTADPVLRDNRFTNVFRELDPGTVYAMDRIYRRQGWPFDKLFSGIVYRTIGSEATHEALLPALSYVALDQKQFVEILRGIAAEGRPWQTAAYMVCAYHGFPGVDKPERLAWMFKQIGEEILDSSAKLFEAESAKEAFLWLRGLTGLGDFLAYQILLDTVRGNLVWLDLESWVHPGPGARNGLKILAPGTRPDVACLALRDMQYDRLGEQFWRHADEAGFKKISLSNIQNCACEFFKYWKTSRGEGQCRARFTAPPTAFLGGPAQLDMLEEK